MSPYSINDRASQENVIYESMLFDLHSIYKLHKQAAPREDDSLCCLRRTEGRDAGHEITMFSPGRHARAGFNFDCINSFIKSTIDI